MAVAEKDPLSALNERHAVIVSLLAQGETPEAILKDYPDLTRDDIQACLAYAHSSLAPKTSISVVLRAESVGERR